MSKKETRPTIAKAKLGKTKIANAGKTTGFFGRKGLFGSSS